ncbi:MAG: dihydropteroate synthase [Actinobacteria bacterium]|uniref:dihydropteroate synthase n=1 Tax=freshwater metagenome TaxID=449393 RepID=A0A6J7VYJ6_9ZZZZ|nr:dihydropteroate synthase [Actinomycetota bacterium]
MIVMGILNVTPDSFADGGRYNSINKAVHHARQMISEGVDIIDIGGESTRPGADRVSEAEELNRVIPVITQLANDGVQISIDTMRASTARAAIAAGAKIINDVSGGLADPEMLTTAAELKTPYIAMHWRGQSKDMNSMAIYNDVVSDVISELQERISAALDAGINRDNLIIDPGIGFAKDAHHNWEIIDHIEEFVALGYPVLIGASRKRFLGGDTPDGREAASVSLTKRLSTTGIWGVRVHSVKPHKDVLAT